MKKTIIIKSVILSLIIMIMPGYKAFSHCDTKSGPVITAAKEALKTGNVNLVLIWVKPNSEEAIKKAFQQTLDVRKTNPKVQDLADNYFFETLVRIHREGEVAPYTGIKEDAEVEPPIQVADKALETTSVKDVLKLLNEQMQKGVEDKYNEMIAAKAFDKNNVEAGREFVEKYVVFMHYVEGIYNSAAKLSAHGTDQAEAAKHGNGMHSIVEEKKILHKEAGHDFVGHLLIIGGTLLIVTIQLITSRKKK